MAWAVLHGKASSSSSSDYVTVNIVEPVSGMHCMLCALVAFAAGHQ